MTFPGHFHRVLTLQRRICFFILRDFSFGFGSFSSARTRALATSSLPSSITTVSPSTILASRIGRPLKWVPSATPRHHSLGGIRGRPHQSKTGPRRQGNQALFSFDSEGSCHLRHRLARRRPLPHPLSRLRPTGSRSLSVLSFLFRPRLSRLAYRSFNSPPSIPLAL